MSSADRAGVDGAGADVRWLTVFLDVPEQDADAAVAFWQTVTRSGLSSWRGEQRPRFATLLPTDGDAYLRVQRVDRPAGQGGLHLDLHVADLAVAHRRALALGAENRWQETGLVVLASPGGFGFCLVEWAGERDVPAPVVLPSAGRSRVNQVCLDMAPSVHEAETAFWTALLGGAVRAGARPEFSSLRPASRLPVRILLQRLDEEPEVGRPPVGAHLDLMGDEPEGLAGLHVDLGASVHRTERWWSVLADPALLGHCVIARDPDTLALVRE